MTKKEKIELQAWFSKSVYSGPNMYYLEDGQIVEFTDPVFTSANVEFKINGCDNQKIWFSQLNRIIVRINDAGDYEGIAFPLFPIQGEKKRLFDLSPNDFCDEVKGKKYKVTSYIQSIVLNERGETIKRFQNLGDAMRYVIKCLNENKIDDLGDLLRSANIYGFERI
jgi:hypothetical protein